MLKSTTHQLSCGFRRTFSVSPRRTVVSVSVLMSALSTSAALDLYPHGITSLTPGESDHYIRAVVDRYTWTPLDTICPALRVQHHPGIADRGNAHIRLGAVHRRIYYSNTRKPSLSSTRVSTGVMLQSGYRVLAFGTCMQVHASASAAAAMHQC